MTKEMLKDIINELKKKNKILLISLITSIVMFIGMTIFAFSTFEFTYEETADITYDITQDADTQGSNSNIEQTIDLSKSGDTNNSVYLICGAIILCVAIISAGVVIYGKSKSKRKDNNKED